jgi:hypothetical protein
MLKFGKTLLLFIPFAAVIYLAMLVLWASFLPASYQKNLALLSGHTSARLREAKYTKQIDVLFLGSSHAYRGFDTRIFKNAGVKSFNLGSSAQTPLQTQYLLSEYLDSLKPKLVIYEVYPITFTIDGVESSIDIISNEEVNEDLVSMAFQHKSIKVYNTLLLSACEQLLGIKTRKPTEPKSDTYVEGGYVQGKIKFFKGGSKKKKALPFDYEQFEAFEENINELKKRNIEYVLVQAPYPRTTYDSFTNLDSFDDKMNSYGKYYNFNECMRLNDSLDFADYSHLNQNGVNAFNKSLLDSLNLNPVLFTKIAIN